MDIIFKCPHCEQELEVDAAGAGSQLACPSCANNITVPDPEPANIVNISTAPKPAAANLPHEEKHFVVPQHAAPAGLIQKPKRILEIAAKDGDKKLRIKSFRRTECQEVGHDRFDEIVSEFLDKIGQANIVSINPISYSHVDLASRNIMNDYGIVIVFKG